MLQQEGIFMDRKLGEDFNKSGGSQCKKNDLTKDERRSTPLDRTRAARIGD